MAEISRVDLEARAPILEFLCSDSKTGLVFFWSVNIVNFLMFNFLKSISHTHGRSTESTEMGIRKRLRFAF